MNNIFSFASFAGYAAGIAVIVSLAGFAVLLRFMIKQNHTMREQKLIVAKLHAHIALFAKEQIVSHDQIASLQEQCVNLKARQQRVEKHGSDTQRIDLATRMLKRGTVDTATLHELGLSASEIKLLLRLHRVPGQVHRPVENVAKTVMRRAEPVATPVATSISAQGQALAELFKTRAG